MEYSLGEASALRRWCALPLRLITGYGFVAHGYAKLAKGPENLAAILHAIGVPAVHLMAWITIIVELGGLLRPFVTFASLPMAAVLLTAMFTVHLLYGFSSINLQTVPGAQFGPPGYEVDLLYLACLATLVLAGPGPFTVDALVRRRKAADLKMAEK